MLGLISMILYLRLLHFFFVLFCSAQEEQKNRAMDFVSPVIDVASRLWNSLSPQIGYMVKIKEKAENLRDEINQLRDVKDDLLQKIAVAEGKLMTPTKAVRRWLERVAAIEAEVAALEDAAFQQRNSSCLSLNFCWSRYKLGKESVNKRIEVIDLKNQGGNFEVVAHDPIPEPVEQIPHCSTIVADEPMIEKFRNCIREEKVGIIGIYGMGGVGKTTLLKKINNDLLAETPPEFDTVIWVVVSKDLNVGKIQKEIGKRLGLSWTEDGSQDARARDLFKILNKKKFLLLLDDVWERLDLEEIGVPHPNDQNKCKIAFTTRLKDVCSDMGAHRKIKVEVMGDDEAWALFCQKVGGDQGVIDSPSIRPLAETVAKRCGGLPLALISAGRAMANKETVEEWKDAIRALNKSASDLRGMEQVFSFLKFSYDTLQDEAAKLCFLYCSLFPEDYEIRKERLVQYWFAEGFLIGFDDMHEACNRGYSIIGQLKGACLLEDGIEVRNRVKMHDVVRDLALWIASDSGKNRGKFLVQPSCGLKRAPMAEKWREAERVSLPWNEIQELAEPPMSPNLSTLMLQGNRRLEKISDSFFQHMCSLRVLDLSDTAISLLPPSLSLLENLRALHLIDYYSTEDDKNLMDLLPLRQLKLLQILNLSGNKNIKEIPDEMFELTNLQYLNLSRTNIKELPSGIVRLVKLQNLDVSNTKIETIPHGRISMLCGLKGLDMLGAYRDWEMKGQGDGGGVSLEELQGLEQLSSLGISIRNYSVLQGFLHSAHFVNCAKNMEIIRCEGLTDISLSDFIKMKSLYSLKIDSCSNLNRFAIGSDKEGNWSNGIQQFYLGNLPSLSSFWEGPMPHGCLQNLRHILISSCKNLKNLNWVHKLQFLEDVFITDCSGMKVLIGEDEVVERTAFPRLVYLRLYQLPELMTVYKNVLEFPGLKRLVVRQCPKLKKLPLGIHNVRTLTQIEGELEWWEELEWEDDSIKQEFAPIFSEAVFPIYRRLLLK